MNAAAVCAWALLTAAATGLGPLPLAFRPAAGRRWLGVAYALAAGAMAAASAGLLLEGAAERLALALLGAAVGLVAMAVLRRVLDGHEPAWPGMRRADAATILMVMGVMTIHSLSEGIGVGVSFGGGEPLGLYITAAIALHNIPEGLAIGVVMVPRGTRVWVAALWSIVSSLPQPLMAVPSYLLVEHFRPLLPIGLGFAAGAMLWMVSVELAPEALRGAPKRTAAAAFTGSALAMGTIQLLLA